MLKQAQNQPKDEFGVSHVNMIYNKEEDKLFCLVDASDKESVKNTIKNLELHVSR